MIYNRAEWKAPQLTFFMMLNRSYASSIATIYLLSYNREVFRL